MEAANIINNIIDKKLIMAADVDLTFMNFEILSYPCDFPGCSLEEKKNPIFLLFLLQVHP